MSATESSPLVTQLRFEKLTDYIVDAKRQVVFCMPSLFSDIAEVLTEATARSVSVIIDPSEDTYRHGLGDMDAVELLRGDAGLDVYEAPGNRIAFLIADHHAYFLFPQSRFFAAGGDATDAVRMDPLTRERLLVHFLPPQDEEEKRGARVRLEMAAAELSGELEEAEAEIAESEPDGGASRLDEQRHIDVKDSLEADPPQDPDLKRKIEVYTAKMQFAEIEFVGSNLKSKRVKVPSDALPFRDPEIVRALETRMSLFQDLRSQESFKPYFDLIREVDELREAYLAHIPSRKKSVFKKEHKAELKAKLIDLSTRINGLNETMQEAVHMEILRGKDALSNAIEAVLIENPPDEIQGYQPSMFGRAVDDMVRSIISEMKFPDPKKVLERMQLKYRFFDLTWDDFQDADFITELREREIIENKDASELRALRDAYEVDARR